MNGGLIQLLTQVFPFLLISVYAFLRYVGPLGDVEEKSDSVFDDYIRSIFNNDDWQQYVDSAASDEALESVLANPDATDLGDVLSAIQFEASSVESVFRTHTRVVHRLLQIPIDIAVTAIAGIVVMGAELLTNPAGATTVLSIAEYSWTIETDTITLAVLVIFSGVGLVLWLVTDSCLSEQSPFRYQSEQRSPDPPPMREFINIVLHRSNRSFCEWLRYYANPWLPIFYNGLAIGGVLIVS